MKKAIVTGASGFIGRFLVRELVKQHVEVIALVHENSEGLSSIFSLPIRIVSCDMNNISELPTWVSDRDVDAVFHLAWQGVSDQSAKDANIQLSNIRETLNLIDAMHEMEIATIVGAGSLHEAEALVEMTNGQPITNPGYFYKIAKLAAHWMGKAKAGTYGIRFFWPLINTYGEEERSARLINTVIRKVFKGEAPELSAGDQIYDFVYVSDVAKAMILIAEKGIDGSNYTVGSGNAKELKMFLTEVGQIANQMRKGSEVQLNFGKMTKNVINLPREIFDITNLVRDTGFTPRVSFQEGVERTARWVYEDCLKQE